MVSLKVIVRPRRAEKKPQKSSPRMAPDVKRERRRPDSAGVMWKPCCKAGWQKDMAAHQKLEYWVEKMRVGWDVGSRCEGGELASKKRR